MTLTRLSPNTLPARSIEEARARGRALYREWLREVPRTVLKYPLELSIAQCRARVRRQFDRQSAFLDQLQARNVRPNELLKLTNLMNLKGCMQLIEIHNRWTQKLHIMRFFDEEVREGQENDKWIPERLPQELDVGNEDGRGGDVIEQRQDGSRMVDSVEGMRSVTPFLRDFLTRKS